MKPSKKGWEAREWEKKVRAEHFYNKFNLPKDVKWVKVGIFPQQILDYIEEELEKVRKETLEEVEEKLSNRLWDIYPEAMPIIRETLEEITKQII